MDRSQGEGGYETTSIYVAVHNINLNDPINEEMVSLQEWPTDKIPQGAITQLEELANRRSRTTIIAGEPILEAKLLAQGEVHDPIGEIPEGMRLKTIRVDAEKSAAGLLSPGDRVDIQLFVSRNPSAGIAAARTKVILQNIRVYAIDQTVQRAADGGEGRNIAKTISLLLTPAQANKIAFAEQIGELNLIPRNPDDDKTITDVEMDMASLFSDHAIKNTREQEQQAGNQPEKEQGSFFGDLVAMATKTMADRPPFVMEIYEAEERREVTFDPLTGRPLEQSTSMSTSMRAGSSLPVQSVSETQVRSDAAKAAQEQMEDFPIDEADFPIEFQDE